MPSSRKTRVRTGIRRVKSHRWASPVFFIKKKDGGPPIGRQDYVSLNAMTVKKQSTASPHLGRLIEKLRGAK